MAFKPMPTKPREIAALEDGYTRISYIGIKAETKKALLIDLEDKTVWVPRSVYTIHMEYSCIDIQNWFYDKNINT